MTGDRRALLRRVLGRLRPYLGPMFGVALFTAALWALHRQLAQYHYRDVLRSLSSIPGLDLAAALAFTVLDYLTLTGYDVLALRYVGKPLAYRRTALASFVAYAFSHSLGFTLFTGAPVRFRLYTAWGLSAVEVTQVVVFGAATFWLGFAAMGGAAFVLEPLVLPASLHLPWLSARLLGALLLGLAAAYLALSLRAAKQVRVGDWDLSLPTGRLALAQLAVASADWALAAGVLYSLLPASAPSYPAFLGMFLLAQVAGVASQVPGGLGVFEGALLLLLQPLPAGTVLAALLAYRGVYYLLPLSLAALLLGGHELVRTPQRVVRVAGAFGRWTPAVLPQIFALAAFAAGAILLLSGATPAVRWRLDWLQGLVPLPVVEVSHLLGSSVGVALLLLAWGLQRRLDAAYQLSVALLAAGVVLSLVKGLDYEEALILAGLLAALVPCRHHFYRKASLLEERFTPEWVTAVVLVLLGTTWLGVFSHRHVEYSNDLWWHFALHGQASRALRATVGAMGLAAIVGLARLLRPAPPDPSLPGAGDLEAVAAIVAGCRDASAHLALLGDKELLFNADRTAFVMFGVEGRSWVALGDPVGPEEEVADLAWRFRELSDRHGGWTAFYEVGRTHLPLYLDLGLTLLKLGEEARVPLASFSLAGNARKGLRSTRNRVEREGCRLEVAEPEEVRVLLPELQAVSDAWLASKRTREKGFSLGFFEPAYLCRFPMAIVRQEGKIVAFANLWPDTAGREELSVDLMRHRPDAPGGVMDYLFSELMAWGKEQGYGWFNLGMAPFSGLESRALAPLWTRVGAFLWRHGEHFYNFQGVREYKEKFDPVWEPRYLASPGGLALPRVLANVAALISGGLKGVVGK